MNYLSIYEVYSNYQFTNKAILEIVNTAKTFYTQSYLAQATGQRARLESGPPRDCACAENHCGDCEPLDQDPTVHNRWPIGAVRTAQCIWAVENASDGQQRLKLNASDFETLSTKLRTHLSASTPLQLKRWFSVQGPTGQRDSAP